MRIRVSWKNGALEGELNETATAKAVYDALPVSSSANTWGKEVYFDLPVETEPAPDARQVVPKGTICYWLAGKCLALPYGPTPISQGGECRLASEVNILGQLEGDLSALDSVRNGEAITVEQADR